MGFRTVFVSDDYSIRWPDWFREKYGGFTHIEESGLIASTRETKAPWFDLEKDVPRALKESGWDFEIDFVIIFLHECGGISRLQIDKDGAHFSEPTEWARWDAPTHSYCYGCSDAPEEEPIL